MKIQPKYKKTGFTLTEMIVTIGLLALIAFVSFPVYGQWQKSLGLKAAANDLSQAIALARTRSANGYHDSRHGIFLATNPAGGDRALIYQGKAYAGRDDIFDEIIDLDKNISLETDIAGQEINFSQGFGRPNRTGNLILRDLSNRTATITINSQGVVDF